MKLKSRSILLSIGGLALIIGMPVSLVISCSSNTTIAVGLNDVSKIKPDANGNFSIGYVGWDIEAVSAYGEIGSFDSQFTFSNSTEYVLRFTLKSGFSEPSESELIGVILHSNGSYYSDESYLGISAQDITDTLINSIIGDDGVLLNTAITGWSVRIATWIGYYNTIYALDANEQYLLEFTLQSNYLLPKIIEGLTQYSTGGKYYTKDKIWESSDLVANYINDQSISNITHNLNLYKNFWSEDGKFVKSLTAYEGWQISLVVSSQVTDSQEQLSGLNLGDSYYIKFVLKEGYALPYDLRTLNQVGESYYSDAQIYFPY